MMWEMRSGTEVWMVLEMRDIVPSRGFGSSPGHHLGVRSYIRSICHIGKLPSVLMLGAIHIF